MVHWDKHVHPHEALTTLAPGLWQVTGSLARGPMPRNMHLWRAPCGGILVHSAICLNDAGMAAIDALGPVQWIVVPCALHRADARPYQERYPQAQLLCPSAARKKVEEVVTVNEVCEVILPTLGIEVLTPHGLKPFELHLLCPLENGTQVLLMTDALFNLAPMPPSGLGGLLLKCMGSVGPLGMTRIGRWLLLTDRVLWRQYLEQLAERPEISTLCVAHGAAVTKDVRIALQNAARQLK